jgi:hypothetical protein
MNETVTVKAGTYNDLIATVHHRLGFIPQDSLVVIAMREPRSQMGVVARVDLASVDETNVTLSTMLADPAKGAADKVILMVFTDSHEPGTWRYPLTLMRSTLTVPVQLELVVRADVYTVPGQDGQWHPYDVSTSVVSAHYVHRGSAVAASREQRLPVAGDHTRATARSGARRRVKFPDLITGWDQARTADRLTPSGLGRLAASLSEGEHRDAVLVLAVTGDLEAARTVATKGEGFDEIAGEAMALLMSKQHGVAPDSDKVREWMDVLGQVAAALDGTTHATGAWTLWAILAWWSGDGASATLAIERALAVDKDYRLAALLNDALSAGIPPAWVSKH